jgi:hypothetical protein
MASVGPRIAPARGCRSGLGVQDFTGIIRPLEKTGPNFELVGTRPNAGEEAYLTPGEKMDLCRGKVPLDEFLQERDGLLVKT